MKQELSGLTIGIIIAAVALVRGDGPKENGEQSSVISHQ